MQIEEILITFKKVTFLFKSHSNPKKIKNHFYSRNLLFLLVKNRKIACRSLAGVAKLVDAPDLGSGAVRRGGSSPSTRTTTS